MAETKTPGIVAAWRVLRVAVLVVSVGAILLALRKPAAVVAPLSPEALAQKNTDFQTKVQQLAQAHSAGEGAEVRLDADEINAAITQATSPTGAGQPQAQVAFQGDTVTGQLTAEIYGRPLVVTISGRLSTKDGYINFDPGAFKVGNIPVPSFLVQSALQNKLSDPLVREKMKLPEYISDIRVENGQLIVTEK